MSTRRSTVLTRATVFALRALIGIAVAARCSASEPEAGLRLWLPLDEGADTLAADHSASRLEAELTNVRWAKGEFGTALSFGGADAFVDLPAVPGLNGAKQGTVSLWVVWEGSGRYPNLLMSRTWSPGGLMFFVSDDQCAFRLGRPGEHAGTPGNNWQETSVPLLGKLPMHKWTHLCVVFDLPAVTTYVNGNVAAKGRWSYPIEADGLRLGGWSNSVCHKGLLDEVRIYSRALKATEVEELAKDPKRENAAYTLVDESQIPPTLAGSFSNRYATLAIDTRGRAVSLRCKGMDRELLARRQGLVSARLKDGRLVTARTVSFHDGVLKFEFPRDQGAVEVAVQAEEQFFIFTVKSLTLPEVAELTFCNLPVAVAKHRGAMANMLSDDMHAVCLRGFDLPVEMALGVNPPSVRVGTTAEHGLTGWRAGLAAGPRAEMPTMLRAMAASAGIPRSNLGGPWSLGAEANRGSYLFADLSLASVDDWIELARRGGFTHIHLHGWWQTLGHYDVNRSLFPQGLDDLKTAVARIHAAGLKVGIHTLTGCIDPRDAWVTPEPSPDLAAAASYTLAKQAALTDTTIYVNEKPVPAHDVIFSYTGNGNAIRIGSEIVQYGEVVREPSYAFAKCQRGAFKTRRAEHAAGARADYLLQRYLAFYPKPDSSLADALADQIAAVARTCQIDQIYFDGSEGMGSRYAIDFMRHGIFKRFQGEVLAEASCHGAHNWWFHSRLGAWDHPVWAAKRFHDLHVAAAARHRTDDWLEPQMGWWAPRQASPHSRGHFLDEMEYFAVKNLGLDAAMSIQGVNVSRQPLGYYSEAQITALGWYERLRLARYFDAATVARVAVPGDEFRLRQNSAGEWQFTPVKFAAHRISGAGNGSERWTSDNPFAAQALEVRIEALYGAAPYDSPQRACAAEFNNLAAWQRATSSPAVTLTLDSAIEQPPGGGSAVRMRAENKGSERPGAWAKAGLTFPAPYRNLAGRGALGVWIKGDGRGALLNIQLGTPREYMHALSDHYITLDFTGWRYVELLLRERDVERMGDYRWPYAGMYEVYRNPLDMAHLSTVNFYLNDLPAGAATEIVLGPVMALPVQPSELKDPTLLVNGEKMTLPVTLKSGEFLEIDPSGRGVHYSDRGDMLATVDVASTSRRPVLRPGANELAFAGEGHEGVRRRAEVTIISAGPPFGAANSPKKIDQRWLKREYDMPRPIAEGGRETGWTLPVRAGERPRVEIEISGAMKSPVLKVNDREIRFSVTLKLGERLLCSDGQRWRVIDAQRTTISEGRLDGPLPPLLSGENRIAFTCAAPQRAAVKLVKVYK